MIPETGQNCISLNRNVDGKQAGLFITIRRIFGEVLGAGLGNQGMCFTVFKQLDLQITAAIIAQSYMGIQLQSYSE